MTCSSTSLHPWVTPPSRHWMQASGVATFGCLGACLDTACCHPEPDCCGFTRIQNSKVTYSLCQPDQTPRHLIATRGYDLGIWWDWATHHWLPSMTWCGQLPLGSTQSSCGKSSLLATVGTWSPFVLFLELEFNVFLFPLNITEGQKAGKRKSMVHLLAILFYSDRKDTWIMDFADLTLLQTL